MITRYSTILVMLCLVTAAQGLVASAAAQARASAAGEWVVPRTPDGHPDLQGIWTNVTITPFERSEEQESPVLTWEQVQERQGSAVARIERGAQPSDPDRSAPRAGGSEATGSVGGYNNVYIDRGTNIAIVNGEYRSSLLTHPSDGRRPDLTPEGEKRMEEYRAFRDQFETYDHPEVRPLGERCIMSFGSSAGPPMIPNTFYNNYIFVQTADHLMVMSEMVHDTRIIRIGEGPRLPSHVRPWMGDSWGRWEGDALVVETTNFNPLQTFRGIPPTEHLKVTERFTRVDEETILYEFTVDDPTAYSEPWGGEIPFKPLNDRVYEYACHEGNYALSNILSGERYQERMEAEEKAGAR